MSVYEAIRSDDHALIEQAAATGAASAAGRRDAVVRSGWRLLAEFIRLAEAQLAPGVDKKAAVLRLAGDFYDRVVAPLDLPGPDQIVDPILRSAWLQLCDHAIDGLVTLIHSGDLTALASSFRKAG